MKLQTISNWMERNEWRPVIGGILLAIILIVGMLSIMNLAGCTRKTKVIVYTDCPRDSCKQDCGDNHHEEEK